MMTVWPDRMYGASAFMTEMFPLAGRAKNITSFSSTNCFGVVAIRGCRVACIAPVAVRGEPDINSLVPAPDGDQSMGSCEFSTNRAALPKATAPAPAIPTLIPVANRCDVVRSNGAVGVNPHDLSSSKISASGAVTKRPGKCPLEELLRRILLGGGYGWRETAPATASMRPSMAIANRKK